MSYTLCVSRSVSGDLRLDLDAFSPKKRGPDQWAPVIAQAIWVSDRYRCPLYSKLFCRTMTVWVRLRHSRTNLAPGLRLPPGENAVWSSVVSCLARLRNWRFVTGLSPPRAWACKLIGDPPDQHVAAQDGRWYLAVAGAPSVPQFRCRQARQGGDFFLVSSMRRFPLKAIAGDTTFRLKASDPITAVVQS